MLIKQRNKLFDLKASKGLKLVYVYGKGMGLFADKSFSKGDVVLRFKADVVDAKHATHEAVRINEDKYLDTKWLVAEAFINHSCSPSTHIDIEKYQYIAIKNIKRNDEITFDYNTTEWDFEDESFSCICGSKNCYREIKGLKYLSKQQQDKLKPFLLSFLLKRLAN